MIVTCTTCSKRYLVDSAALGASGRNVRCAACGHTWFQAPPEDAPRPLEIAPEPPPSPGFAVEGERRERRVQLPAVPKPRKNRPLLRWGAVGLVIVAAVWGLIAARADVMKLWPPAAQLYAMVGYGPTVPGFGLELRKVTPSRTVENGVPTLAIDGEVVNVSSVARDVPKLRIALRDNNDHDLQSWTISITNQRLLPGASVPFHTTVKQPSQAATGVIVSFVGSSG
jgi:predicted Zn finger-like uncharacterized protein